MSTFILSAHLAMESRDRPKLSDQMAYPPRAMRAERAAAYLSMSKSMFLRLVDDGIMPNPVKVGSMALWDRFALDAAFDDLAAREAGKVTVNTVLARLEQLGREREANGPVKKKKPWSSRDSISYRDLPKKTPSEGSTEGS